MCAKKFNVIREGLVLVDFGPVTMTLEARKEGAPFTEAALKGADKVLSVYEDLVTYLEIIRRPVDRLGTLPEGAPDVVRRMVDSVCMLGERNFTPMAAVAGTVADIAAEAMEAGGADYAIANNGGDIAWRIPCGSKNPLRVGLISDISTGKTSHKLEIKTQSNIHGLATSGLGGRSLTRGIASAVTALAQSASGADAAATAIANACFCDDPAIERCLAEELDYGTDIAGLTVTRSVGPLKKESVKAAISAGKFRAEELIDRGLILGAVLFVQDEMLQVGARNTSRGDLFILNKIV